MVKLALEIPTHYWDEFVEYCDFHYALAHEVVANEQYATRYRQLADEGREVWLDNSFNEIVGGVSLHILVEAARRINPTHIFLLEAIDPEINYLFALKSKEVLTKIFPGIKTVSCWRGDYEMYEKHLELADIVALPYDEKRHTIQPELDFAQLERTHYLGFLNRKELEEAPPRSIDTSLPIRAALHGVEFNENFERPPGGFGYFKSTTYLTSQELKLAKKNCEVLRNVLNKLGKES